jgi:ribosomal protein S18 acetylase RimI-like enzyme
LDDAVDEILARIERYFDAVPRAAADGEDHGPLTLFRRREPGWPYYARPRLGWPEPPTPAAVTAVRERQRELGLPESLEWVAEVTPSLADAAKQTGLAVHEHPLMVLDWDAWSPVAAPDGVTVRMVPADDPDLRTALAVTAVAFQELGTGVGKAGRAELARAAADTGAERVAATRNRIQAGLTLVATASDGEGPLATGLHQPIGDVSEVVGVGTLPFARRRGLGTAVVTVLVRDAVGRGAELVCLTATDDAVARVYGRAGFRRVGTAMIAGPPD